MADMTDARDLEIRTEWESAPGVRTPELAATWARLSIWVRGTCVTSVEDRNGSFRRAIYASAYPLAEWIAYNWWFLTAEVRPSSVSEVSWSWANVKDQDWLNRHNLRATRSGFPWPDLTLVPEGAATRAVWKAVPGLASQPVAFLKDGSAFISTDSLTDSLAGFVESVVERLRDQNVVDTPLHKEWQGIRDADSEEVEFARAAARLGIDPYAMEGQSQDDLIAVAEAMPPPLRDEFLDSVDPGRLSVALRWVGAARRRASAVRRPRSRDFTARDLPLSVRGGARPWEVGYEAARAVRGELGLDSTKRMDVAEYVARAVAVADSAGLEGFVAAERGSDVALVLPRGMPPTAVRFAQARALGLSLFERSRSEFLLDPARTESTKRSRAFAAELLAPAEGIREMLGRLPGETDAAFDAIAQQYAISPLVVRWQHDNQLIRA